MTVSTTTTTSSSSCSSSTTTVDHSATVTPSSSSSTTPSSTTTLLVLYGSQTGNSEQAAHDFCQACTSEHLYNVYCNNNNNNQQHQGGGGSSGSGSRNRNQNQTMMMIHITTKCMSLDDFLYYETNHCNFHTSTILIIFVSSYGVGGPPLGCHRFRDVCDGIIMAAAAANESESNTNNNNSYNTKAIQPQQPTSSSSVSSSVYMTDTAKRIAQQLSFDNLIQYAICGLGDSKYTTYMNNPTVIDTTFRDYLHATPLCPMGRADASSSSSQSKSNHETQPKVEQADVIAEWVKQLWDPLSTVVYTTKPDHPTTTTATTTTTITIEQQQLQHVQQQLIQLCQEIIPDYHPTHDRGNKNGKPPNDDQWRNNNTWMMRIVLTIFIGLISMVMAQYYHW